MELKPYFSNLEFPATFTKDNMVRWYLLCEDDCITHALTSHLKRKPIKKDFEKCEQRMIPGRSDRYNIAYKGTILGALQHHYDNLNTEHRIGVEFIPAN